MKNNRHAQSLARLAVLSVAMAFAMEVSGQETDPLRLPEPDKTGGKPLMQALSERASSRSFSEKKLSLQTLSNLLWAGFGVNRSDSGKRTAPSASNRQEIDIYAAMEEGLYLYDAKTHSLNLKLAEDIRALAGQQRFTERAPVNLIFVSDRSRMGKMDDKHKDFYSATDTGFISQNIYLFCASEGLATVVLGMVDREALGKKMGLGPEQAIILTQPVGHPE